MAFAMDIWTQPGVKKVLNFDEALLLTGSYTLIKPLPA